MKLGRATFTLLGGLAVVAAGCAHDFVYLPIGPGGGAGGEPAAQYPIPPDNPQGEVYVTSFGFTDVESGAQQGSLLHVRLAVTNGSSGTWTLDAQEQRLMAPGQPAQPPTTVNTDAGGNGPTYEIPPGRVNVFDLYFSVPPPQNRASALASFFLDWNVNAGGRAIAEVTSFQRFDQAAPDAFAGYPPYVTVGLGFGAAWWGPPFYPIGGLSPFVRGYYYPPSRMRGGPWRGPRPGGWRAVPPTGGWMHAGPRGGFHGAPGGGRHR